jgi:glycosyltransferase involved in cell wall biosynthesis
MPEYSHLVSLIVPVFNRKDIVKETINSVRNQTYTNWELIIVDDGSIDGTSEHLLEIVRNDPRIFFFQRDLICKGAPTCRNIGIRKALGDYIIFLDSDDVLAPNCLQERLFYALKYPGFDFLVFPGLIFFDTPGDSQILWNIDKDTEDLTRFLQLDAPWQTSAIIWKKEAVKNIGFWDERLSSWQDMDYHTRAIIYGLKYKKINNGHDYYYRVANVDKISKNDKTIKQLYSRIVLIENIINYLKEKQSLGIYKEKVYNFYMWICLSFIKQKHYEGVVATCKSLYKMGLINFVTLNIHILAMKGNYYFIYHSFNKYIFKNIRNFWIDTIYSRYFNDIPPIDCTVKLVNQEVEVIKSRN